MIKVIEPGTEVTLYGSTKAKIESVLIEAKEKVSYKVRFWNGQALVTEWVDESMVENKKGKLSIGFKK